MIEILCYVLGIPTGLFLIFYGIYLWKWDKMKKEIEKELEEDNNYDT